MNAIVRVRQHKVGILVGLNPLFLLRLRIDSGHDNPLIPRTEDAAFLELQHPPVANVDHDVGLEIGNSGSELVLTKLVCILATGAGVRIGLLECTALFFVHRHDAVELPSTSNELLNPGVVLLGIGSKLGYFILASSRQAWQQLSVVGREASIQKAGLAHKHDSLLIRHAVSSIARLILLFKLASRS